MNQNQNMSLESQWSIHERSLKELEKYEPEVLKIVFIFSKRTLKFLL